MINNILCNKCAYDRHVFFRLLIGRIGGMWNADFIRAWIV